MKNQLKIILWISILTACSILIFQVFWVYRTYHTSQENFNARVNAALQRSVDIYLLERIDVPLSLSGQSPTLSIISTVSNDKEYNIKIPLEKPGPVRISYESMKVDTANLESTRLFLAKMIALSHKEKITLSEIGTYFREELNKERISVDYKLSLHKHSGKKSEEAITTSLGRGKGDWVIEAKLTNTLRYKLSENSIPAVVSLFLILLTAGSLWYMGLIIRRQKQLDNKKNNFINNITHEFRTPIAILKSTNEALLQFGEASNPEKTARYLQINAGVLNKLDEDIDRLLNITRYELGTRTVTMANLKISELVNTVINKFQLNDNNSISFIPKLEQEFVNTDKYMVETILTNLVDNALKYTDGPSKIVIEVSTLKEGWQLVVRDNGHGISEENLPLIFDKFYRVTTGDLHEVKGYGIGLSYVKQLVLLLGGEITVESQIDIGTTFIIKFPA